MKRFVIFVLSIISILLFLFMWGLEEKYCVGVEVKTASEMERLLQGKKCVEATPETLWNDEHGVFYDRETNTIFVSQSLENEQFEGIIKADTGSLYLEKDALLSDVKTALAESKRFTLYQVMDDSYCQYKLLFTGVPVMNITVEDTYQELIASQDKLVSVSTVEVVDPYSESEKESYKKVKGEFYRRGRTSYLYDYKKPNYTLKLTEEKASFLGMRKDEDWILNSLMDDMGMIHNKTCYTIWNNLSKLKGDEKTYSTNMEYIDLFIDHKYMGTYGLMERIDQKELNLSEKDILYKIRSPRVMEDHNYTNEDADGLRPIALLKYPKEYTDADWIPLKTWNDYFRHGWIDNLEDAYRLIDYQNAIDYNIYCLLIYGIDNVIDNSYLVADYREEDGTYLIKRIPWDINQAFGCQLTDTPETNYMYWDESTITNTFPWSVEMSFLYTRDEKKIAADTYTRWIELRQDFYTREKLYQIVDDSLQYLHNTGAYGHNYEWYPFDTSAWQEELVYEYLDKRIAFLDQYFEKLYRASIGEPVYVYDGVDYTAEFNPWYYWYRYYEELYDTFGETFDEEQLFEHYVLIGKPNGWLAK